jgi:PHP family Zn ribbon phosphoesterase
MPGAKQVGAEYNNLIEKLGNEFEVLLNVSRQDLTAAALPEVAEGIERVRDGKVFIEPGYDGVYGKVKIFSKGEEVGLWQQKTLF